MLVGAGKVSHKQTIEKANREYQRLVVQNLSHVEEAYLQTIKEAEKQPRRRRSRNEQGVIRVLKSLELTSTHAVAKGFLDCAT